MKIVANPKAKTLVIRIDWWLWRVVASTGAITELAKRWIYDKVIVATSRPLVFWWNPYVEVRWLDDRNLYCDCIRWNDYKVLEPYDEPSFFNDWENWLPIFARQLWLDWEYDPVLFLTEQEKCDNRLEWNRVLLFQPFGSTMNINGWDKSYRSIRVEDAQYIANELANKGWTVYNVIKPNSQPTLNNTITLDTPDLRFVLTLCARYPVLWCDSSLHHIAKWLWKKAVVVWHSTDAWRFWYKSNTNLKEKEMVEYVPLRLMINDFNFDCINQHTNEHTKERIDNTLLSLYN